MRIGFVAILGVSIACILHPSLAYACSHPPVSQREPRPVSKTAKSVAPLLLRIVALESATFPKPARARVLEVGRGPYKVGQIIRIQPVPGSVCGPERIAKNARGLIEGPYLPKRPTDPIPFFGFVESRR